MIMSEYEIIKALSPQAKEQMLRFTRSSLKRNIRKARNQYEQESEEKND